MVVKKNEHESSPGNPPSRKGGNAGKNTEKKVDTHENARPKGGKEGISDNPAESTGTRKPSISKKTVAHEEEKSQPYGRKAVSESTIHIPHSGKGILVGVAENIEEGARIFGEKSSEVLTEVAEKTSRIAGEVFGKVKKGMAIAYDAGSKLIGDLYENALEYKDKYQAVSRMKKLTLQRNALEKELGVLIYKRYRIEGKADGQLFSEPKIRELFDEIESLDMRIVTLGRELDETGEKETSTDHGETE